MMRAIIVSLCIGANLVLTGVTQAQEDGEAAFSDTGCARCHAVEAVGIEATASERMRGPDLGGVGRTHDASWVIAVVKRETELENGLHRARYPGSDDQLKALAAWLVGLE